MGSLKGAGLVVGVIAVLVPVVSWVVNRSGALGASGATLSFTWRITMAATDWYVRFLPFIAIGGVASASAIGGYLSRHSLLVYERRALLGWLMLAVPGLSLPFIGAMIPSVSDLLSRSWIHGLTVLTAVGLVAPLAAVALGAHLQSRIRISLSSRIRGWHIAVGSAALAVLGPALLIPPLWVWMRARSVAPPVAAA